MRSWRMFNLIIVGIIVVIIYRRIYNIPNQRYYGITPLQQDVVPFFLIEANLFTWKQASQLRW